MLNFDWRPLALGDTPTHIPKSYSPCIWTLRQRNQQCEVQANSINIALHLFGPILSNAKYQIQFNTWTILIFEKQHNQLNFYILESSSTVPVWFWHYTVISILSTMVLPMTTIKHLVNTNVKPRWMVKKYPLTQCKGPWNCLAACPSAESTRTTQSSEQITVAGK